MELLASKRSGMQTRVEQPDHIESTLASEPKSVPVFFKNPCPIIKNEISTQRGSFWDGHPADIRGSFARISRPKTSVRAVKILEKKGIWARISMTRRRGRPRPEGISKNFGQKNFGLNFRSLKMRLDARLVRF